MSALSWVGCSNSTENPEAKDSEEFPNETVETKYAIEWFTAQGTESEEHVHEGIETTDGSFIAIGHGLNPDNTDGWCNIITD